jgi:acyl-CoA thioester hydrolase
MKPSVPSLEKITALPFMCRVVVPPEYEDMNGHMNVRHYMTIFDEAGYPMIDLLGMPPSYHEANGTGGFDLEHHLHYLNEVHIGDTVTVYLRFTGRSAKRMHYLMFMVNETRQSLASIFECVNSFADLKVRRTAPFPAEIAAKIDEFFAQHEALDWEAPICGVMKA